MDNDEVDAEKAEEERPFNTRALKEILGMLHARHAHFVHIDY
jgi:hypothetical protein